MTTIPVDPSSIPQSLIEELWKWYVPRDKYSPISQSGPTPLGVCHKIKNRPFVKELYRESYASLRGLKELRCMVEELAFFVNEQIDLVEEEVLPVSRVVGIHTLPCELVTRIMALVGDTLSQKAEEYKRMLWAFCDIAPFSEYVHQAKIIANLQKHDNTVWDGHLPRAKSPAALTELHLTVAISETLPKICDSLKPLVNLEVLVIKCHFDYPKITEGDDIVSAVSLPSLQSLSISNIALDCYLQPPPVPHVGEPLRRIVRALDVPKLRQIDVCLDTREEPESYLYNIDEIFDFPNQKYPSVQSFNIQKLEMNNESSWGILDPRPLFQGLPSLTSLSIEDCETIRLLFFELDLVDLPLQLRYLKLTYKDSLSEGESERQASTMRWLINTLIKKGIPLSEVDVSTRYESVFEQVNESFSKVRWVTDRSILDGS